MALATKLLLYLAVYGRINLLVLTENFNTLVFYIILSANEDKRKFGKLQNS
jgi:hypothetical protein